MRPATVEGSCHVSYWRVKHGCQVCPTSLSSIHKVFFFRLVKLTEMTNCCFSNQNRVIIIEGENR